MKVRNKSNGTSLGSTRNCATTLNHARTHTATEKEQMSSFVGDSMNAKVYEEVRKGKQQQTVSESRGSLVLEYLKIMKRTGEGMGGRIEINVSLSHSLSHDIRVPSSMPSAHDLEVSFSSYS